LEFFSLTPLPGSADHKRLYLAGAQLEADMNKYDVVHVTTPHAVMSDAELLGIYRRAWELYYSPGHVETVLRRSKAWGYDPQNMMWKLMSFHVTPLLEKVHPLEGGIVRRKYRRDRRHGMPLENPVVFYARYAWEMVAKHVRLLAIYLRYRRTLARVMKDSTPYTDTAMTPVKAAEYEELEMFKSTHGGKIAVEKLRKRAAARPGAAPVPAPAETVERA
ncbi:MAG: radical SAM protein, partial [Gammaproteobacteria bacterium]|nr:radical SAM protein [Gammaproteobacteria bacterium]